jgi:AcrR family transcriptional regulator
VAYEDFGQVDKNRILDPAFWRLFGLNDEPTMREKIIALTIDDIGRVGPTTFNAKEVCEVLEVTPSLINHHFGGRDELIAEATFMCYRNYVSLLWKSVEEAPKTPRDRLRAWIETQIYWSTTMRGWGPILNYPTSSLEITKLIEERFQSEMTKHAELNMARLIVLVGDVRRNKISNADFQLGKIPKLKLIRDVSVAALAASIGWSTLGISVWNAGRHLPTGEIDEIKALEKVIMKSHIDRLIDQIVKDK